MPFHLKGKSWLLPSREPPFGAFLPQQRDTVVRGALILGSTYHILHHRGYLPTQLLVSSAVSTRHEVNYTMMASSSVGCRKDPVRYDSHFSGRR